jgi:hypothetical protein
MSPWIDRQVLIRDTREFVRAHGLFLRRNGRRISSLVEISVYNSIVRYYESLGFQLAGENLGPKRSFRYKLIGSGLTENHSYFTAKKGAATFHILHNILIQSAHHEHLYFTADVVVANQNGSTTRRLQNGRRHSFVANPDLVTFAEVKHLHPYPGGIFSFMGLVLEFMPGFVNKTYDISDSGNQLCPVMAFTGPASAHAELIKEALAERYGINISFNTSSTFGQLTGFATMKKYSERKSPSVDLVPLRTSRRFSFD